MPTTTTSSRITPSRITPSRYKDQEAITIESDLVAAQFLPNSGTNLCSLLYKPANLQMMIQRPGERYRVARYGADYVEDGECAGLDEMFPTIDRAYYAHYPWQGTELPDHGEVWSLPWTTHIESSSDGQEGDSVHFETYGVRLPYRLQKSVSFTAANTLHFAYRLTNLAPFAMDFLWAAHPMFVLQEGAELTLPDDVTHLVTAFSPDGLFGRHGDEHPWPVTRLSTGQERDLRRIQPRHARNFVKFYTKGALRSGWCSLTYPANQLTLRLDFPAEQVPYLGILPNEGGWQELYNIFLEPATASFDRPDVARLRGESSTVGPHGRYEWFLSITISD